MPITVSVFELKRFQGQEANEHDWTGNQHTLETARSTNPRYKS